MLRTIDQAGDLSGKRIILRCDLNVPLKDGVIQDDGRIRASLPTIRRLVSAGAKVLICSHLGRPEGSPDARYSLAPIAARLEELLGQPVAFASDTVGAQAHAVAKLLETGGVAVLENLRFNAGEATKDVTERQEFAAKLAELGDVLVSDGFGVVHRKQASVYELAKALPSFAGLLVAAETAVLERLVHEPGRPYTVVLGGSKVSDKLGVLDHLLPRVNRLVIGGGMVFTVLKAKGFAVGKSLLEEDQVETVRGYLRRAEELGVEVVLPVDIRVADRFAADAESAVVPVASIEQSAFGSDAMGLDIGPDSEGIFAAAISSSATVFWNGPMGVFEFPAFASGTRAVAQALTEVDGLAVVGGGDSAAAVRLLGFEEAKFGHISTGGGASLEYLEGKNLPGLEVLND